MQYGTNRAAFALTGGPPLYAFGRVKGLAQESDPKTPQRG